jgi:hypothetical protein
MRKCSWHLCNAETKNKFCSKQCKWKMGVHLWRKRTKEKCIEYKGGSCSICGYSKCADAMEFHHVDSSEKEFGIGGKGVSRSWDRIKVELDKCVLLCANCHREVHYNERLEF